MTAYTEKQGLITQFLGDAFNGKISGKNDTTITQYSKYAD